MHLYFSLILWKKNFCEMARANSTLGSIFFIIWSRRMLVFSDYNPGEDRFRDQTEEDLVHLLDTIHQVCSKYECFRYLFKTPPQHMLHLWLQLIVSNFAHNNTGSLSPNLNFSRYFYSAKTVSAMSPYILTKFIRLITIKLTNFIY